MRYTKPTLTFDQQADLLLSRGLSGDRAAIISKLEKVSYYRLCGYWHAFREVNLADPRNPLDTFKPGSTFDEVWARYAFDRQLRLLVMDAIERIEVALRTQLAHLHALRHGIDGYVMLVNFPNMKAVAAPKEAAMRTAAARNANAQASAVHWTEAHEFKRFLGKIAEEIRRNTDDFVVQFRNRYPATRHLPTWIALEIMSFGTVVTFYRASEYAIQDQIAGVLGVHRTVLQSWLLSLNAVRNICAHHGRLWNRKLGVKPRIPAKLPSWVGLVPITGAQIFGILTICKWSLDRLAPQSQWSLRLRKLIGLHPQIPIAEMGFPDDWEQSPIWALPPAHNAAP